MEKNTEIIDELLNKDCYIIDFLPETVPENAKGQFFEVEHYLLNSEKYCLIKERFVCVILKMMCYYHVSILWNEWVDRPKPEWIENVVAEMMIHGSGTLNCLFPDENMLLVFERDSLNLSIYNPPEKTRRLLEQTAFSEGLFWRKTGT